MIALASGASEAWYARGWARVFLGRPDDGVEDLLRGMALWGVGEADIAAFRDLYRAEGLPGVCAAVADFLQTQTVIFAPRPTDIAALRPAAGQTDLAFAALETALARDDPYLLVLGVMPWFDELNNDPRWRPLLKRARPVC